jgi:multiple sugar transport system permease protein
MATHARSTLSSFRLLWQKRRLEGYLFILPWLLGLIFFQIGPIVTSLLLTTTHYDVITEPRFIGLGNFRELIRDPLFYKSLSNTLYFVAVSVPVGVVVGMLVAVMLNQELRGILLYRILYYLPSVTSGVAVAMLWLWIYDTNYGLINTILLRFRILGPGWLSDPRFVMPSLIILAIWASVGQRFVIFLAGLNGIPSQLYEAAKIDGASGVRMFFSITLPMLSPTIFFALITGVITAFQGLFTYVYIMTTGTIGHGTPGGPLNSAYVYVLHIYRNAFDFYRMGYACALAWVLFVIIFVLTLLQVKFSGWVYYEGQSRG